MAREDLDEALEVSRPAFLSSAQSGYNVFATLDAVTQKVLRNFHLRRRLRARQEAAKPARGTTPVAGSNRPVTPTVADSPGAPSGRSGTGKSSEVALGS